MRTLIAFFLMLSFAGFAAAQTAAQKKAEPPKTREELMQRVLLTALANIEKIRCAEGKACAPATEAEKKNPPLTLAETSQAFGRGILSGGAAYCEMDWNKRNYLPMMTYWQEKMKKNDRQLALISLVHDIAKDQLVAEFWGKGKCPDEMKKDIESKLNFKP